MVAPAKPAPTINIFFFSFSRDYLLWFILSNLLKRYIKKFYITWQIYISLSAIFVISANVWDLFFKSSNIP